MTDTARATAGPEKPRPHPIDVTRPFWDGLAEDRLRLQRCDDCHKWVGRECWNERAESCTACAQRASAGPSARQGLPAPGHAGTACPNCQAPSEGGRFCHECGFDMASTHKSCPGCGALQLRAARFCTDCGHGF